MEKTVTVRIVTAEMLEKEAFFALPVERAGFLPASKVFLEAIDVQYIGELIQKTAAELEKAGGDKAIVNAKRRIKDIRYALRGYGADIGTFIDKAGELSRPDGFRNYLAARQGAALTELSQLGKLSDYMRAVKARINPAGTQRRPTEKTAAPSAPSVQFTDTAAEILKQVIDGLSRPGYVAELKKLNKKFGLGQN